jgi:hypothetical protein
MSKWIIVAAFLCAGLATACGGDDGSGVSGSKSLVTLSDGEVTDLCEFLVDVGGPERMIDCGGGLTLTVGGQTVTECNAGLKASQGQFPNCTATVKNAEECAKAISDLSDQQLCSDGPPPAACQPLFTAACGGL